MDLVRKQSEIAQRNVIALVQICGNWFALRRIGDELEIRRMRGHSGGLERHVIAGDLAAGVASPDQILTQSLAANAAQALELRTVPLCHRAEGVAAGGLQPLPDHSGGNAQLAGRGGLSTDQANGFLDGGL